MPTTTTRRTTKQSLEPVELRSRLKIRTYLIWIIPGQWVGKNWHTNNYILAQVSFDGKCVIEHSGWKLDIYRLYYKLKDMLAILIEHRNILITYLLENSPLLVINYIILNSNTPYIVPRMFSFWVVDKAIMIRNVSIARWLHIQQPLSN
jgi:hypothetical protein